MRSLVILGTFVLLMCLERRRPLRRTVESPVERTGRNMAMAGLAVVALRLAEQPVAQRLTAVVERRRWGVVQMAALPHRIETVVVLLLLDYTLYLWHVLTHRVPSLWRMHIVHHVDLDLDVSTAVRFHAVELLVSVVWRAAQIPVHRGEATGLVLMADADAPVGAVSPFQCSTAGSSRALAGPCHRHAAYARHSSFNRRG